MSGKEREYWLTVTVQHEGDRGVKAVNDQGGEPDLARFDIDPLRRETIDVFDDLLRRDELTRPEELQVLGSHLYAALFNGTVRDFFMRELNVARAAGKRLRLQLAFEGAGATYLRWPWEFLYYSDLRPGNFLALRVDLVLTRYVPPPQGREPLMPLEGPLKILVAISRPEDLRTIRAKDVVEALEKLGKKRQDETGQPSQDGDDSQEPDLSIEVHVLQQPTVNSLVTALKKWHPHVLHFMGHGEYSRERRTGKLALIEEDGVKALWCSEETVLGCFREAKTSPRLVFLHMCEGGEADSDYTVLTPFTGLAPNLLRGEIPAVVAMKYLIKNRDVTQFSLRFYRELASGQTIDTAVQEARASLGLYSAYSSRVFGTPVLYMNSSDAIIMPKPRKKPHGEGRPADMPPAAQERLTARGPLVAVMAGVGSARTDASIGSVWESTAGLGMTERASVPVPLQTIGNQLSNVHRALSSAISGHLQAVVDTGQMIMEGIVQQCVLERQMRIPLYKQLKAIRLELASKDLAGMVDMLEQRWKQESDPMLELVLEAMLKVAIELNHGEQSSPGP